MQTAGHEPESIYVQAINTSKGGIVVANRMLWATTSQQRRRGLLEREQLDQDEGMYIVPTEWVHTFGMHFPIDVAFLSEEGVVLTINRQLRPNRFSKISLRAQGALELAAGRLAETGTEVGDKIEFRDV